MLVEDPDPPKDLMTLEVAVAVLVSNVLLGWVGLCYRTPRNQAVVLYCLQAIVVSPRFSS